MSDEMRCWTYGNPGHPTPCSDCDRMRWRATAEELLRDWLDLEPTVGVLRTRTISFLAGHPLDAVPSGMISRLSRARRLANGDEMLREWHDAYMGMKSQVETVPGKLEKIAFKTRVYLAPNIHPRPSPTRKTRG